MGKLSCGCEITPGAPLSAEQLKAHYKHTFESLVLWDLILRRPRQEFPLDQEVRLSTARIEMLAAIEERFPEVKEA